MGNKQDREAVSALEAASGVGLAIAGICTGGLVFGIVGVGAAITGIATYDDADDEDKWGKGQLIGIAITSVVGGVAYAGVKLYSRETSSHGDGGKNFGI